jgi:hypothetical protein
MTDAHTTEVRGSWHMPEGIGLHRTGLPHACPPWRRLRHVMGAAGRKDPTSQAHERQRRRPFPACPSRHRLMVSLGLVKP